MRRQQVLPHLSLVFLCMVGVAIGLPMPIGSGDRWLSSGTNDPPPMDGFKWVNIGRDGNGRVHWQRTNQPAGGGHMPLLGPSELPMDFFDNLHGLTTDERVAIEDGYVELVQRHRRRVR